jgi:chloramphenicol-sensitive protein RarD
LEILTALDNQAAPSKVEHGSTEQRRGVLCGAGAYLLWGFITIYWKALKHFDAFELIAFRIVSSALVMTVGMHLSGQLKPLLTKMRDKQVRNRAALSAVVLSANWTVYVWAVVHGHVLQVALGYFITPIGMMVVGVLVLHERLRNVQIVALACAILAVIVLAVAFGEMPLIALVIASTWVVYSFTKKRSTLNAFESLTAETLVILPPAIVLLGWTSARAGSVMHTASGTQLGLVLLSGVVTALPLLLFAAAAQRLDLSNLALLQYIVPTINFFLGWLLYSEQLTVGRVAGFALVWVGLVIVSIDSLRRAR